MAIAPKHSVVLVIIGAGPTVLTMLRDDKPGIVYPNRWALLGGSIESGEEPLAAALRETEEECGLKLVPEQLTLWKVIRTTERERFVWITSGRWTMRDVRRGEGQAMRFTPLADLAGLGLPDYQEDILRELEGRLATIAAALTPRNPKGPAVASCSR